MTRAVLWHNPFDESTELCRLIELDRGFALEGVVLAPANGQPARVDYRVEADEGWRARSARLRVEAATWAREIRLERNDDRWLIDGRHDPSLDGCVDVDLRITPATNTLPIRRLRLAVGGSAAVTAAWVGFPELEVRPLAQTYERVGDASYRYRSNGFEADLEVDDTGIVVRYGEAYWRAIASAPTKGLPSTPGG